MVYLDEKELFERLREGQLEAFNVLFRHYYPLLLSYASNFVDLEDAENIVQDVMLSVWERRKHIYIQNKISTYLYSAVRNRCFTQISRGKVKEKIISNLKLSIIESTLEEEYFAKEAKARLQKTIASLPTHLRVAFEMSRLEGKKYTEIAEELHISVKTVEYRISKALALLREKLK